ncbi:MAG: glycosyltransferase family 2 protein [Acidobacteriota bacterium]
MSTEEHQDPVATESVAVCIVTWNSADDLPSCLDAVAALDYPVLSVVVVDCASDDDSVAVARHHGRGDGRHEVEVIALGENRGFAGGMNAAFDAAAARGARWVLTLNPDAQPAPDFVTRLLKRAWRHERVGAVTGRLVRPAVPGEEVRLDACGMVLRRAWRHLDRGSDEVDRGQYATSAEVFGATGAACLYALNALDDVAFPDGARFDPLFHSYREDAELCFRLRSRGWRVLYEPTARCLHRRGVLPRNRSEQSAIVNYHSLKNRYLLRAYHQSAGNFLRTLPWTLARDLLALGYVVLRERTSIAAYPWLWRHRHTILARRRWLRARRTEPFEEWFRHHEVALHDFTTTLD